jgi:mannose-6-phosphate isomerase
MVLAHPVGVARARPLRQRRGGVTLSMTDRQDLLREGIKRPLPLAYHPLYRFYEGGSLTRNFRGLAEREDDWWSEDWVGSCTCANNPDPDGHPQGLSTVDIIGVGAVPLQEVVEAWPEEMVGASFATRWGPITGVLVKLLSPRGPVPVHAHPTREWAQSHLGSKFGKTEAWIFLETPGDGSEPAHAGLGFTAGVERAWFAEAVRRHDSTSIRSALHRMDVHPGDVFVAHAGVPHYLGPRVSFIEVQEPSDLLVIAEAPEHEEPRATMGLGWDVALDMIDYTGQDRGTTLARAQQSPRVLRSSHGSREVRLFQDDVLEFFDATVLEVTDNIDVDDGRFSIAIVTSGDGSIHGNFGDVAVRRGETFALPAHLPIRVAAGREPLRIVRCFGPTAN